MLAPAAGDPLRGAGIRIPGAARWRRSARRTRPARGAPRRAPHRAVALSQPFPRAVLGRARWRPLSGHRPRWRGTPGRRSLSSNIAHLPGTGLLDGAEEALIALARRVDASQWRLRAAHAQRRSPAVQPAPATTQDRCGRTTPPSPSFRSAVPASPAPWPHSPVAWSRPRRTSTPGCPSCSADGSATTARHSLYPAALPTQAWLRPPPELALLGSILGITADAAAGRFEVLPDPAFAEYFPLTVRGGAARKRRRRGVGRWTRARRGRRTTRAVDSER